MLVWALTFLAIAITAGVLGVGGIASASVGMMQVIFAGVLLLFALSLTAGKLLRRS